MGIEFIKDKTIELEVLVSDKMSDLELTDAQSKFNNLFDLLLNLKKNVIFNLNIKIFIDQLNNGIPFNKIIENHDYFDSKFITFFKIGFYTQSLDQVLIDYLSYQKNNLNRYMKRFTVYITTTSYLMISLLIVSIYQMLLIPIDMIQNF